MMKKVWITISALFLFAALGAVPVLACSYYDAHGDHDWYQSDVEYATCETDGYYVLKCKECGTEEKYITDTATGHSFYETGEQVKSTCMTKGWHKMRCERCGLEVTFNYPLADHKWSYVGAGDKATCTKEGWYKEECSVCGKERTISTGYGEHEWVLQETVPSTCVKQGHKEEICWNCGMTKTTDLPLAEHKFGEFVVTVPATDHSKGTRTKTCSVCGKVETEDFYPDGTIYKGGPKGDPVKDAQQKLIDLGFLNDVADGSFGGKTEGAVKGFQSEYGLTADGIGWPQTLQKLDEVWNKTFNDPYANSFGVDVRSLWGEGDYPPVCIRFFTADGWPVTVFCEEHLALSQAESEMGMDGISEEDLAAIEAMWTDSLNGLYDEWEASVSDEKDKAVIQTAREAFFKVLEGNDNLVDDGSEIRHRIRLLKSACVRLCGESGLDGLTGMGG